MTLVSVPPAPEALPLHALGRRSSALGRVLGLNVGSSYLRVIEVVDSEVGSARSVQVEGNHDEHPIGISVADLATSIRAHANGKIDAVGIAWSAPRILGKLRAESEAMSRATAISNAMRTGELDHRLSDALGCRVTSWHDGEAVAAGEALMDFEGRREGMLVFKLGTSVGAGLALEGGICALPLQVSKCIVAQSRGPHLQHPLVGTADTLRVLVGASGLGQTYARAKSPSWDYFSEYCDALGGTVPYAEWLATRAADSLTKVALHIADLIDIETIVLSGKNLECVALRNRLLHGLGAGEARERGIRVRLGNLDCDYSAALGAAFLAQQTRSYSSTIQGGELE